MRKKLIVVGLVMVGLMYVAACGSSSGTGSGTSDVPSITTIDALPKATSPMAAVSTDISKDMSKAGIFKAATTGLNLLSAKATNFDNTDSMAACETFNVVKDSIVSAAQADMILCFVQNMSDAFEAASGGGTAVDVYDGEWHVFNMNIVSAGEGTPPDKVKMQIVKNAAGNITSFKMFMCQKNSGGPDTQNEYVSQTLDGASFTMIDKGEYADAQWSGSHQVTVTGTLNASNVFTQKTIVMKNTGGTTGDVTNTNWQEATLAQTPGGFTVSGYQKGIFTQEGYSNGYQQAAYGVGEMLGDTSADISNLAMGDGAVDVDGKYTFVDPSGLGSGTYDPAATVFAWLGDTLAAVDPASGSIFHPAATAGTIPPVADSVAFEFSADQTWDCSDDVATAVDLPEFQEADLQTACSQYGSMNHNWIDCYQAIGQYENPDQQQQAPEGCAAEAFCGFFPDADSQAGCAGCFPYTNGTYGCLSDICNGFDPAVQDDCNQAIAACQQ